MRSLFFNCINSCWSLQMWRRRVYNPIWHSWRLKRECEDGFIHHPTRQDSLLLCQTLPPPTHKPSENHPPPPPPQPGNRPFVTLSECRNAWLVFPGCCYRGQEMWKAECLRISSRKRKRNQIFKNSSTKYRKCSILFRILLWQIKSGSSLHSSQ